MKQYLHNHVQGMWNLRGTNVCAFGKDQTGLIRYSFNNQGFRSQKDYDRPPSHAFFGCSLVFGIGVAQSQIFAQQFADAHNYGLAGSYTNRDIFQGLWNYLNSEWYSAESRVAVFWTDRDHHLLDRYYASLSEWPCLHFFCGPKIHGRHCYQMLPKIDTDISGTHMGPESHAMTARLLRSIWSR